MWKVDRVEYLLPGADPPYGFNITNDWGKPLVSFCLRHKGASRSSRSENSIGYCGSARRNTARTGVNAAGPLPSPPDHPQGGIRTWRSPRLTEAGRRTLQMLLRGGHGR
jgi:hypothetical protein